MRKTPKKVAIETISHAPLTSLARSTTESPRINPTPLIPTPLPRQRNCVHASFPQQMSASPGPIEFPQDAVS
jgi:hypothetical protein